MVFMGGGAKAVAVWGIVSIILLLLSYLLIVKPILDDTNEQIDATRDIAIEQTDDAFDSAEELQEEIQEDVDESLEQGQGGGGKAEKGANSSGGVSAAELQEQIQDQVNEQLEDAGVAP
jgi:F0F1-type ATP synthase membrane subunit b/b'